MNTDAHHADPMPDPQAGCGTFGGGQVVLVMTVPNIPCSKLYFPSSNYAGTQLLRALVLTAAEADGQFPLSTFAGDELNSGFVVASYDRPELAAQAWCAALLKVTLRDFWALAWRSDDHIWHPIWPIPAELDFESYIGIERMRQAIAVVKNLNAEVAIIIKRPRVAQILGEQS